MNKQYACHASRQHCNFTEASYLLAAALAYNASSTWAANAECSAQLLRSALVNAANARSHGDTLPSYTAPGGT